MKNLTIPVILFAVAAAAGPALVRAETRPSSTFDAVLAPYETVRQALLGQRMEGVAESARRIRAVVDAAFQDLDAASAGVPEARLDDVRALLPGIREGAGRLEKAEGLPAAREAFADLFRLLVQYRGMLSSRRDIVAYCPMVKKSWLQPEGEIGNPYGGQEMTRCGTVVPD